MIRSIFLFVVLGIGLFVGTQYAGQQGYVLISAAGKTIEMSVTSLVVMIIVLLAILFGLEFLIKKVLNTTTSTWNWFGERKLKKSRRFTNEGIVKLIEGDWKLAEKKVTRLAKNHDMPLLCYLIASEAALEQGNNQKREHYLSLASQQKDSTLAVELTKARQYIKEKNYQAAQKIVSELSTHYPSNPVVLTLLKSTYYQLQQWPELLYLLPQLKKRKLIEDDELQKLKVEAHCQQLSQAANQLNQEGLQEHWNQLARKTKSQPEILTHYIRLLIKHNEDSQAFKLIKEQLKKQPESLLSTLLPELNLEPPQAESAIKLLKDMVQSNEHNAEAQSALGRFYMKQQQWSRAQTCFETALRGRSQISDYRYLAQALEYQNMAQAAHDVSQKALSLASATDIK
ncbi:putative protoheme IX biogenesis protein [Vibrio aerogenes CECT 7868]|uniref:Putative protoheme IX biogenesis protein n=1 Tax=Vibrio aerogenes CECT 7868 TaxID=1216006 RepID=A0A1M5ZEY2_9VIBR|nr:heme biosynthesis HemY N-terminal domain-containing protein [Vibrio aerogenes]SHI22825.1 putative protoheme IX biogenesis protein [Vibrio aerogenes CECT 7868]